MFNDMKKSKIIYEETRTLTAKYYHPKSDAYLDIFPKPESKIQVRIQLK